MKARYSFNPKYLIVSTEMIRFSKYNTTKVIKLYATLTKVADSFTIQLPTQGRNQLRTAYFEHNLN